MLKISKQGEVLKVEGTLGGAWVSELQRTIRRLLDEHGRATLDLSSVVFVDRAGAELLLALRSDSRVEIGSVSAFVAEMLKGGAA